jgi:hypothetical protein
MDQTLTPQPSITSSSLASVAPPPQDTHAAPFVSASIEDPWSIEILLRKSWQRTKSRFLPYFISSIVTSAASFGVLLACLIVFGVALAASIYAQQTIATVSVLIVGTICTLCVVSYVQAWGSLASTFLLLDGAPGDVRTAWYSVKPKVMRKLFAMALITLLSIGLLIYVIPTLLIVYILWTSLLIFVDYLILTTSHSGFRSVWASIEMVQSKLLGIVGRVLILSLSVSVITGILTPLVINTSGKSSTAELTSIGQVIQWILGTLFVPIQASFYYEMYKLISIPVQPKRPSGWIIASAVGWVLSFVLYYYLIVFITTHQKSIGDFFNTTFKEVLNEHNSRMPIQSQKL